MKKYRDFIILILFTMGSQALIYFLIKYFITDFNVLHSIMNIPFVKYFIYVYNSWYPFILISAFVIYKYDSKQFYYLIPTMLLAAVFSQITFVVYPSVLTRPAIEVHGITDWLVNFTYQNDTPAINCLPSMHCVYCFLIGYYALRSKTNIKGKITITAYSLLIVASTLLVRQHIIEDVILAFIYSTIAVGIISLFKKKIDELVNKRQKKKC